MIPFATSLSFKLQPLTCSPFFIRTEIVLHTICGDFTTWPLILAGSRGPILAKRAWPKIRSKSKRAITAEEHGAVIASEKNAERRAYYELLYETGAAQTDAANLTAENVDRQNGILVYQRKKLGPFSEPARLTIGTKLRQLLQSLPCSGDLFPNIKKTSANYRSAEFRRRCRVARIDGISLHSYRHAWAQRAKACGYPQRFAQEALGHGSRAIHEAYARGAIVVCPALDQYESVSAEKLIHLSISCRKVVQAKGTPAAFIG